jgi:hypothetical protein
VVVNDRGPFSSSPTLVLDVSKAAAHRLGFPGGGKIPIECRVIDPKEGALALKQHDSSIGGTTQTGVVARIETKASVKTTKPAAVLIASSSVSSPNAPKPGSVGRTSMKPQHQLSHGTPPQTSNPTFLLVINEPLSTGNPKTRLASYGQPLESGATSTLNHPPTIFVPITSEGTRKDTSRAREGSAERVADSDRSQDLLL